MQLWQQTDHRQAHLRLERFAALVDPCCPQEGLRDVTVDGLPLAGFHPLAVDLSAREEPSPSNDVDRRGVESYVRGGDLIADYAERPAPRMRSAIYWRARMALPPGTIAAVELVASLQTELLDSFPEVAVRTRLVASEAWRMSDSQSGRFVALVPPDRDAPDEAGQAPECYLFRLAGRPVSYAEMVHPADARQSNWEGWLEGPDYRLELRHRLFARSLEKGVILRSRVLGVLVDRQHDLRAAAAHWSAFVAEAPPLTA